MRHCVNETVEVHEATGDDAGMLLIEAAGLVHSKKPVWTNLTLGLNPDGGYLLTVYLHG